MSVTAQAITHPDQRLIERIERHMRAQAKLRDYCQRAAKVKQMPALTGEEFGALCDIVNWTDNVTKWADIAPEFGGASNG